MKTLLLSLNLLFVFSFSFAQKTDSRKSSAPPGKSFKSSKALPTQIIAVSTSVPIFAGYTEKAIQSGKNVTNRAVKINSLREYEQIFGKRKEEFQVSVKANGDIEFLKDPSAGFFKMYYSLQLYFANGGGPCYIVSIGKDRDMSAVDFSHFKNGIRIMSGVKEASILVFPDAGLLQEYQYYPLYKEALSKIKKEGNQFLIADVYNADKPNAVQDFRDKIGSSNLSYAAAYYPNLITDRSFAYDDSKVSVSGHLKSQRVPPGTVLRSGDAQKSIYHLDRNLYHKIKAEIEKQELKLPPSAAVAGVYVSTDKSRGVWKAPANVKLNGVRGLTVEVDNLAQETLNVHSSGKSINAIRFFTGKGFMVWGARTLDGNSHEWKYVNQRRFSDMVKVSVASTVEKFQNEPNNAQTWSTLKSLIESFLMKQWRAGALQGQHFRQAAFVRIGLGETMDERDLTEGKLRINIGLSEMRPAEFKVIKIEQQMQH